MLILSMEYENRRSRWQQMLSLTNWPAVQVRSSNHLLFRNLIALLFERRRGLLDEKLLTQILRGDLFLGFFVPPFHFFVFFFLRPWTHLDGKLLRKLLV